jgi:hypothetical protein
MGTFELAEWEGIYECFSDKKKPMAKAQGLVELHHQHLGGVF